MRQPDVQYNVFLFDREEPFNLQEAVKDFQTEVICCALHHHDGNITRAADLIGINRTTLIEKMKSLKIDWDGKDISIGA